MKALLAILLAVFLFPATIATSESIKLDAVQPIQYEGDTFCTVFSINEKEGYFGTAGHCAVGSIGKDTTGKVTILGKPATVEMIDLAYDVAVFQADVHIPALKLAKETVKVCDPKKLVECELVSARGFPYGLPVMITVVGRMAAHDVPIPHPGYGKNMDSDIIDLTVAHGNSGSPVVNGKDEVIGVLWGASSSSHTLSVPLVVLHRVMGKYFEEE